MSQQWESKKKKEKLKSQWHPQLESRYYIGATIYGTYIMEVYFTYDLTTFLLTRIVHNGDFPINMILNDKTYNLDNEEVDISDLLIYMEADENGNLFPSPEVTYDCSNDGEV